MIKITLAILAILIALAGFSQLVAPMWWAGFIGPLVDSPWLRFWGAVSILLGLVFIAGSLNRSIGSRLFLWVLGWIIFFGGLAILINPGSGAEYTRAVYLDRSPDVKLLVMWLSGLLRIALGAAIYHAVAKPDTLVHR